MSTYCIKRTAPKTFGIFDTRDRNLPLVDSLTFAEAREVTRRAAIEPGFSPIDYFDGVDHDDWFDAAAAEAEMFAEFGMSWIAGGGSRDDVGRAWAEYGDRWNGVELVGV